MQDRITRALREWHEKNTFKKVGSASISRLFLRLIACCRDARTRSSSPFSTRIRKRRRKFYAPQGAFPRSCLAILSGSSIIMQALRDPLKLLLPHPTRHSAQSELTNFPFQCGMWAKTSSSVSLRVTRISRNLSKPDHSSTLALFCVSNRAVQRAPRSPASTGSCGRRTNCELVSFS